MEAQPFSVFIQNLKEGVVNDELSASLQALVASVTQEQKKGSLKLSITITPNKGDSTVLVTEEIELKEPKPGKPSSLFFVDRENNLSRQNPKQMTIEDHMAKLKQEEDETNEVNNER